MAVREYLAAVPSPYPPERPDASRVDQDVAVLDALSQFYIAMSHAPGRDGRYRAAADAFLAQHERRTWIGVRVFRGDAARD